MRKAFVFFLLAVLSIFLFSHHALASPISQQTGRDDLFEREVIARLTQVAPEAVPIFRQATADWDAGNTAAAKAGFERVLQLAPGFPDALRRLANIEVELGLKQQAVEHARAAYAAAKTSANAGQLAEALLALEDTKVYGEALALAKEAANGDPNSANTQLVLVRAAAAKQDMPTVRQAISQLLLLAPDFPLSHYYAGLLAMDDNQWSRARDEMVKARELGMPEEYLTDHLKEIQQHLDSQQTQLLWARRVGLLVAGWLVTFGLLFAAGLVLSRITQTAVRRPHATDHYPGTLERGVRSVYAAVIALTAVFFYVSLPLVAIAMLLGAAGLVYAQLRAPRVSPYLLAMTAIVGLYTALAIVRSIFVRIQESEPGRLLTEAEAPGLWALTREIAECSHTRPVDAIYIAPSVEVAVTERGRALQKLRGKGSRCLIIGLAALPGMTQAELAAILAHEYGHFSNRDTAGGNLAYQVNLSMHTMAYHLARQGLARWYNPAWWFINGFSKVFFRTTLGASRLREILADRFAAVTYGSQNLADGLTRIVRQDLAFDLLVDRHVRQSVARGRRLPNLYAALASASTDADTVEKRFAEVMGKPTSAYDSHPALSERIRLVQSLPDSGATYASDEPATDLFGDIAALQNDMMAVIQARVSKGEKDTSVQRAAQLRQAAKESVPEVAACYEKLAQAVERRDYEGEAQAWEELAEVYEQRELPARAANCWGTAAICYADLGDQEGERVARYNKAETFKDLKEWTQAETELRKVVALDEATASPDLEADRAELAEVAAEVQKGTEPSGKTHRH